MNYQSSITMSTVDDIILLTFSFSPSLELHKTDNHLSIINDCFLSSPFFFHPSHLKHLIERRKICLLLKFHRSKNFQKKKSSVHQVIHLLKQILCYYSTKEKIFFSSANINLKFEVTQNFFFLLRW